METVQTLPFPTIANRISVYRLLLRGIIYLTSESFFIFASITAALLTYIGAVIGHDRAVLYGAIAFLCGFTPWSVRLAIKIIRQTRN